MLLRLVVYTTLDSYLTKLPLLIHDVVTSAILAIIIIVVAVPEGLPMMIAIVLSLNMRRLLRVSDTLRMIFIMRLTLIKFRPEF